MPTLAEIILRGGENAAANARSVGDITARGKQSGGQIWGGTVQNLASILNPARILQERDQMQQAAQQREMGGLQLKQAKRADADVTAVDTALQEASTLDGIIENLSKNGQGHLVPTIRKQWGDADKASSDAQKAKADASEAEANYFGNLGATVKAWNYDQNAAKIAIQHAKASGHDVSQIEQLLAKDPSSLPKVVDALIAASPKQRELTNAERNAGTSATRLEAELPGIKADNQLKLLTLNNGGISPQQAETNRLAAARDAQTAKYRDGMLKAAQVRAANTGAKKEMTPNQMILSTRQLRNDYVRETASALTAQQQLALMKDSMAAVKAGSQAAGSQGVLVTFQKILDPNSVVRESEYARSGSGQSLINQLEGQWSKIQAGGAGVKPEELQRFVDLSEKFAASQKRFAEETRSQIDGIADEFGLNKGLITRDLSAGAEPASDKSVTTAELQAIAKSKGTTLEQEKARAAIAGYVVR